MWAKHRCLTVLPKWSILQELHLVLHIFIFLVLWNWAQRRKQGALAKQLAVYFVDANNLVPLERFCRVSHKHSPRAYAFISNYNSTTLNPLLLLCQTFNWIIQNMKQKERIVNSTLTLAELAECWELLKGTLCLLIGHLILLLFVGGKHPLGKDFLKNLNCDNAFLTSMNILYKQKLFKT